MLFEIDVLGGENSPMDLNRVFDLISGPRAITQVLTADSTGNDRWCDVTGWGESGPCPALAALNGRRNVRGLWRWCGFVSLRRRPRHQIKGR